MKFATTLVALLVSIPFLECFCGDANSSAYSCEGCEQTSDFPQSSHDCLELLEFFTSSENLNFCFLVQNCALFDLYPYYSAIEEFSTIRANLYTWFGKLKPNLALNIIQI